MQFATSFSARLEESKAFIRTDGVNIRLFFSFALSVLPLSPFARRFFNCLNDHYLMFAKHSRIAPDMISESPYSNCGLFISPCFYRVYAIFVYIRQFYPRFFFPLPAHCIFVVSFGKLPRYVHQCCFALLYSSIVLSRFWGVCAYRSMSMRVPIIS